MGLIQDFRHEAKHVWQNSVLLDKLDVSVKVRKQRYAMTVAYNANEKGYASGRTLYKSPKNVTIYVRPDVMKMPQKKRLAILRHEAIHLGYQRHDQWFRSVAKEVGAPEDEMQYENPGYHFQVKEGSHYKTVKTIQADYPEIASLRFHEFVQKERKKSNHRKYRLIY